MWITCGLPVVNMWISESDIRLCKKGESPLQELIDLLDAIIGDLRDFESEGYPAYLKQVKKANTGDSEGLYDLLDVVGQILEDLEEHQSENVPMYRQQLEKLADEMEKCHLCNASFEEGESLSLIFVKGEVNHLICESCTSFLIEQGVSYVDRKTE